MSDRPARIRIIRADHLQRKPWKNGGGATADLAVSPPGAGFDDFDWRISMADVESDGPFSSFPGVDRTLVVLHGDSITLDIEGRPHRLDATSEPLTFRGEARTTGRLSGRSIRDFNVMTRRTRYAHRVARIEPGTIEVDSDSEVFLLAEREPCTVRMGGDLHRLARLDALHATPRCLLVVDAPVLEVRLLPIYGVEP